MDDDTTFPERPSTGSGAAERVEGPTPVEFETAETPRPAKLPVRVFVIGLLVLVGIALVSLAVGAVIMVAAAR